MNAEPGRRPPVVTAVCVLAAIAIWIGITASGDAQRGWSGLARWGLTPATALWDGAAWGFLSSVLVHLSALHLAFNLYWWWRLGAPIEQHVGWWRYLALLLAGAWISSGCQFAWGAGSAYGASGVVYALAGFAWLARRQVPALAIALDERNAMLLAAWLPIGVLLTMTGIFPMGNTAHAAGLACGLLAGLLALRRQRTAALAGMFALLVIATVPLRWCPWSPTWLGHRGYLAHAARDYAQARVWYERSIARGGDRVWALDNLARAAHSMGDQGAVDAYLRRLEQEDPARSRAVRSDLGR